MKLSHFWAFIAGLTLLSLLIGYYSADLPAIQYLGNAAGVLLGFALGVAWQEHQRQATTREAQDAFWVEYSAFLRHLDAQSISLKTGASGHIYESIRESRLPVIEANHLLRRATDLTLDAEFRRQLFCLVNDIRVIDDYLDLEVERLNHQRENLSSRIDRLREKLVEMMKKVK